MSVALFSPLFLEIGDFTLWVKARNAFLTRGFLPSGDAKLVIKSKKQEIYVTFLLITQCERSKEIFVSQVQSNIQTPYLYAESS